jgi:uncharacterized protein (TIGR00369 family)
MSKPAKAERKPRDPGWEARVRASFARQSFMELIGGRIVALAPGRCEIELPFRRDLCQQHGYLHGGVVTAIAANAAGYAAFSLMPADSSVLGVEYKINLMGVAAGERFVARGTVLRAGRTLSVVQADVEAEQGGKRRPVARMLATMMCMEGKPELGAAVAP